MPKLSAFVASIFLTIAAGEVLPVSGATESPAEKPADAAAPKIEAVISVKDQRLAVLKDGELLARFPVSTSRFGVGDQFGSYRTPLGQLRVCEKIGGNLPVGAVLKHQQATGEVLPPNAPGRDPIVSRILWLEGLEKQNENARARKIYIHGTAEEKNIGKSVSWGCIRMRSKDVVQVFEQLPVGATVTVCENGLRHYKKYTPPPEPKPEVAPAVELAANRSKAGPPAPAAPAAPPKPAPTLASSEVAGVHGAPAPAPKAVQSHPDPVAAPPVRTVAAAEPKHKNYSVPQVVAVSSPLIESESSEQARRSLSRSILLAGLPDTDSGATTHTAAPAKHSSATHSSPAPAQGSDALTKATGG